jgi:hypothetical protein
LLGRISQKHGNTLVGRANSTALVLPQFKDSDDLGDILHTLDEPSLSEVEKHYPG